MVYYRVIPTLEAFLKIYNETSNNRKPYMSTTGYRSPVKVHPQYYNIWWY